jgi:hypothetical protein
MTLLEIEYKNTGSSAAKNDFVIYSSFFKDPSEVMTSPEVERMLRLLPKLMRVKRRAKMEFQRLRAAYQPELPERRMRRIKDILVRMYPSPLLPNYYAPVRAAKEFLLSFLCPVFFFFFFFFVKKN